MSSQINWEKVGKVVVIVACGAGFVALTVTSAGTVAIGAGATAASLGASSAVSGAVSTAATIGTYTVAGGTAATTLSDAGEIVTDGHNVIRDDMIAPLAGQEHASEIYNNSKLMLTLASLGITQFAADNPQFRPLPKNKNLQAQIKPNLDPKANTDLKLQTESEVEADIGQVTGGTKDPNRDFNYCRSLLEIKGTSYDVSLLKQTQPYVYDGEINHLVETIKEMGPNAVPPIKILVKDGSAYIVDGHHRYNAFLKLGYHRVPIKYLHSSNLGKTLEDGTYIRSLQDILEGAKLCSN